MDRLEIAVEIMKATIAHYGLDRAGLNDIREAFDIADDMIKLAADAPVTPHKCKFGEHGCNTCKRGDDIRCEYQNCGYSECYWEARENDKQ